MVGQGAETSYVMFVLDCSGSMLFPGAPAESGTSRTRLEQAKDELPQVVESICSSYPNVNVGLILFGHREDEFTSTGEATSGQRPTSRQLSGSRTTSADPGTRDDVRDQFASRIRNLQPRGVTPLYRSIILAMQEFPRDSSARRHVVVLSDGADLTKFDHQEVLKVLRARVDVFEYKMSPEEREKYGDEIEGAHVQICGIVCTDPHSRGEYYSNLTSWLDAIRNLQRPTKEISGGESGG